jgi:hypothetical protein
MSYTMPTEIVVLTILPPGTVTSAKESTRVIIVSALLVIFAGTIAGAFWGAASGHWDNFKALLDLLLPAETALLGTAVAFYMTE